MEYDLIVIGGGVVGCAIAREASRYNLKIALFEKEPDVCEGISKANSGVLHAGFNVKPGSLKARFNVQGLSMCQYLTHELDVDYKVCGKLVVGSSKTDLLYLEKLLSQGEKNNCTGLSIIGKKQIEALQPGLSAEYALLSESTGVISPFQFTIALAENAAENGVDFRLNCTVCGISQLQNGGFRVSTSDGRTENCRFLINSAGMHAADIKSLIEPHETKIFPCRGEYYITDKTDESLINMAVYPVPPSDGSGLGVHLTPTCNGNILIGPSANYIENGDNTATTRPVMDQLKEEAAQLLPKLKGTTFIKNYAGMRPKLFDGEHGTNFADFIIEESKVFPGMINLIGIESPGLTSAPAIAVHVLENIIGMHEKLTPNPDFNPQRKGVTRSSKLDAQSLKYLTAEDPNWGEIICRCEHISRAEILQALHNPLGAVSLSAIKKRTYSMMGRCQSGFCLPKIIDIITAETGLKPEEILKTGSGSEVITGRLR